MLPRDSVGAEIGVWRGDLTASILEVVRPARLHLIDPWLFLPEYSRALFGGESARNQDEMDRVYRRVVRRFSAPINRGVVTVHRVASSEAANEFEAGYFDWVYVDGNHTYDYVRADLEAYASLVKPGGLLAGDDYGAQGWWDDGVTRAVDEFVAAGRAEWLVAADHFEHQFVLRLQPGP